MENSEHQVNQAVNLYGFRPAFGICLMYVLFFTASFVVHSYQAVKTRYWFLFPTVLAAGVLEILGWAGRLWSNKDENSRTAYIMQSTALVIAPTLLLAAHFVVFGRIVSILGTEYSRLRPRFYTIVFLGGDIFSLFTQGAGGGLAASGNSTGEKLLLAGIALQLVMIGSFSILAVEFVVRHIQNRPHKRLDSSGRRVPMDTHLKILLMVIATTTGLLFIRGIYRVAELSGGWESTIRKTEWPFNLFEGATIFLVFFIWNVGHPSKYLEVEPKVQYDSAVMLTETGSGGRY